MDTWQIIVIVIASIIVLLTAIILIVVLKKKDKQTSKDTSRQAEEVFIKDGVRYNVNNDIINPDNSINVSLKQKDILLKKNIVYTAARDSKLLPGSYTILSTDEGVTNFNVRIGGFVKDVKHGSSIVLSDNEEISPVSHSLILR